MVMVGTGHGGSVDLTPIWFRELEVIGAYGRQVEDRPEGRLRLEEGRAIGTYQLVHELMLSGKLPGQELLTHKFRLDEYRSAFETAMGKGRHKAIKVAIDFRD